MEIKQKILYVDDEFFNLQLFKINFGNKYDVLTAEDAMKAWTILDKYEDIVMVVSDIKMPVMNGFEFVLKARKEFPDPKYCLLSGMDITPEIKSALSSNIIFEYFMKPFDVKVMHEIFENLLAAS